MIRAHAIAVKNLTANLNMPVYDGETERDDEGAEPDIYMLFSLSSPSAGPRRRLSIVAPKSLLVLSTMVRGSSPNECRWAVEKLHDALIYQRLTVSGRRCDPFLPPESTAEIRLDDSIQPPAWVCTEAWPFYTSPL